jgi:hypothetical protein
LLDLDLQTLNPLAVGREVFHFAAGVDLSQIKETYA